MSAYVKHMGQDLAAAANLFKALSHPARLLICCQLLDGPMNVAAMEATLGLKQPNLSRELAKLRAEGIVSAVREAGSVTYKIADGRVQWVLAAYRNQGENLAAATNFAALNGNKTGASQSPFQGGGAMFARTFVQEEEV